MNMIPDNVKPFIQGTLIGFAFVAGIQIVGRIMLAIWM